jgi:hypothetical protein
MEIKSAANQFDFNKNDLKPDQPIYGYRAIDPQLGMLAKGVISLTCPNKWTADDDDPFENWLFQATIHKRESIQNKLIAEGRKFFAHCWSLNENSHAMWRLYADEYRGFKIQTTPQKLFEAVHRVLEGTYFYPRMGKVLYKTEAELQAEFKRWRELIAALNQDGIFEFLLIKRKAYASEEEVRLIVNNFDAVSQSTNGNIREAPHQFLEIQLQDIDWIDAITFGAKVSDSDYQSQRAKLVQCGVDEHKIHHEKPSKPQYTVNID